MAGIIHLSQRDFYIAPDSILKTKIPGLVFVLFYADNCSHCVDIKPIIGTLAKTLNGCKVGVINLSNNYNLVKDSMKSKTPITHVPYIIFFSGGDPKGVFSNEYSLENFRRFIEEKSNSTTPKDIGPTPYSKKACYFNMDQAYGK